MTNRASETQAPKDVFEAIRTLLAVRSYQDKPVPDAVVRRIVEAGRLTGSGMNGQPWHFIVIRDGATLRRLGALASSGSYVAQAPLAIVVATDKTRFAVSDASRAIQSMLLAAWAEGRGLELGGLRRAREGQGRPRHPGRPRCAGDPAVRLSGSRRWTRQEAAQAAARGSASRAVWAPVRVRASASPLGFTFR